jgi:hypothetical protein
MMQEEPEINRTNPYTKLLPGQVKFVPTTQLLPLHDTPLVAEA